MADPINQKCKFCNAETIGSDVCYKCLENPIRQDFFEALKDSRKPISIDELTEILNSTIKRDEANKVITFLAMLLTYTEEDQINVSFTAESSTGKSYIPLELAWYFPKADVVEYSYVSPTAFYHEYGILIPDPSDTREDVEPEKRRKINYIDLHRKILIFLDQPHDVLLQRLRPLLSHDRKILISKITDHREKSGLRTKTVKIEGYPTVLFCTAKFSMEDQERTRLLMLSPEVTEDKIKDAIMLKIEKESDRKKFNELMESDPRRVWLANRVADIATANIDYIIIPEEIRLFIADRFFEIHKSLIPRHQRDITRLLALIKAHALLNLWHRQQIDRSIVVNKDDALEGFNLYLKVSKANELGLPPEVYSIFNKIKDKIPENGLTRKEIQALYYQIFNRTIGKKRLDEILGLLLSVGLLTEELDPIDKRQKRFLPPPQGVFNFLTENNGLEAVETTEKINTPQGGGITKEPECKTSSLPVCGDCEHFHKQSCVHPSSNFDKLPSNAAFACYCRSFKLREES